MEYVLYAVLLSFGCVASAMTGLRIGYRKGCKDILEQWKQFNSEMIEEEEI